MDIIKLLESEISEVSFSDNEEERLNEELKIINSPKISKALSNFFKNAKITDSYLSSLSSNQRVVDLLYNYVLENELTIVNEEENQGFSDETYSEDPMQQYLNQIGRIPLLTAEEETEIFKKLASTEDQEQRNQLRKEIVEKNTRLAVSVAKRYQPLVYKTSVMEFLDLVQAANEGLIKAVDRFDITMGYKFSTYATWWIRQSLTRTYSDEGRSIRLPVHVIDSINKINRIKREYFDKNNMEPTLEELAELTGFKEAKIEELENLLTKNVVSLDIPVGEDEDSILSNFIPDESNVSPESNIEYQGLKSDMAETLDCLTPREKEVLILRFGINRERGMTLEEVGKEYKVTRERIRQIEAKALRKLRHPNRSRKIKDYLNKK